MDTGELRADTQLGEGREDYAIHLHRSHGNRWRKTILPRCLAPGPTLHYSGERDLRAFLRIREGNPLADERADGKPMGIADIWERGIKAEGRPSWSMSMLTINADGPPVMQRFHKPGDEKRSVVILPDDEWGDWLRAKSVETARGLLRPIEANLLRVRPDPLHVSRATDFLL